MIELPCCCPVCTKYSAKELNELPEKERTVEIARHNLYLSFMELRNIKQAIREGTLWELVEQRATAHPKLLKALKAIRSYNPYLESVEPRYRLKGVKYLTEYSLHLPVLSKQRRYMAETYKEYAKTLILIPELDEPSYTNKTVKSTIDRVNNRIGQNAKNTNAVDESKKNVRFSEIKSQAEHSIYIVSDIVGLIPFSLADVYPNSQHEGHPDITPGCQLIHEHLTAIGKFLERYTGNSGANAGVGSNEGKKQRIMIYYPDDYINEFGETESYYPQDHLIGHIILLSRDFPGLSMEIYRDLEELLEKL